MSNPPPVSSQETSGIEMSPAKAQPAARHGKPVANSRRRTVSDGGDEPASPNTTDELLRVLILVMGSVAFPEHALRKAVRRPGRAAENHMKAYNLCDGTRSMREIGRMSDLGSSNMVKAISRWVEAGVAFRLGSESRPVHVYRLGDAIGADAEPGAASASSPISVDNDESRPRRMKMIRAKTSSTEHDEPALALPLIDASAESER